MEKSQTNDAAHARCTFVRTSTHLYIHTSTFYHLQFKNTFTCSFRDFEETFENPPWRKLKQMMPHAARCTFVHTSTMLFSAFSISKSLLLPDLPAFKEKTELLNQPICFPFFCNGIIHLIFKIKCSTTLFQRKGVCPWNNLMPRPMSATLHAWLSHQKRERDGNAVFAWLSLLVPSPLKSLWQLLRSGYCNTS